MTLIQIFRSWYQSRRELAAARAPIESGYVRWPLTLLTLAIGFLVVTDQQTACVVVACIFFAAMSLHFLLLLFRTLHFTLLELFAAAMLIGTVNGLLLSMPGIFATPLIAALLALSVTAWVFYGVVHGLVCARLLGISHSRGRMNCIAIAWFSSAAPAFLISAVLLLTYSAQPFLVTESMKSLAAPFFATGALGILLKIALIRKVNRKLASLIATKS